MKLNANAVNVLSDVYARPQEVPVKDMPRWVRHAFALLYACDLAVLDNAGCLQLTPKGEAHMRAILNLHVS